MKKAIFEMWPILVLAALIAVIVWKRDEYNKK